MTMPSVDFMERFHFAHACLTSNAAVELYSELKCSMEFRSIKSDSRSEAILCGSFHAERQKRKKKSSTKFSLARFCT